MHRPPLISIPDAFRKAPSPTGWQSLLRQVTLGCVRRVSHHLCSKCTQQEHASAKSQAFRCRCLAPFSGVVLRLLDGPGYACGCNLTCPTCRGPEVESNRREPRAASPRSAPPNSKFFHVCYGSKCNEAYVSCLQADHTTPLTTTEERRDVKVPMLKRERQFFYSGCGEGRKRLRRWTSTAYRTVPCCLYLPRIQTQ